MYRVELKGLKNKPFITVHWNATRIGLTCFTYTIYMHTKNTYIYMYTCTECIKAKYGCFMTRSDNNTKLIASKETARGSQKIRYRYGA